MINFNNSLQLDIGFVQGYEDIKKFLNDNKDIFLDENKFISFDIETKNLNLRGNKLLGFGVGFSKTKSRYIITRDLSLNEIKTIFKCFNKFKCKKVLHNSYFDISQLNYLLGFEVKWDFCTYIMAHCLHTDILLRSKKEDRSSSLSLKELCKFYYPGLYGYEDELEDKKKHICRQNKINLNKFDYSMFTDEDLIPYGNYDVLVTYALFEGLLKEIKEKIKNGWDKLNYLLNLKHKVTPLYIEAKVNGIRVDRQKVLELNTTWNDILSKNLKEILEDENIKKAESLIYMNNYNKEIQKKELEFEKKLEERLEKIKKGKYSYEKLNKVKDNIRVLTPAKLKKLELDSKLNLRSSSHKRILFLDLMELKPIKYNKITKTSKERTPKVDKNFMNTYSYIPLVDKIREYSLYVKGVDGFLGVNDDTMEKGLWNLTSEDYPINHPNSNLQGTITHRVAQNSVNLQQLPSRGDLSSLKKCIVPLKDNHRIIALDYSSCELYILGALSQEPNLLDAIKDNLDLHSNMALGVWGDTILLDKELVNVIRDSVKSSKSTHIEEGMTLANLDIPLEDKLAIIRDYKPNLRYNAKSINFGLPYGIQSMGLAQNMKVTQKEAKEMLETYMDKNSKIQEYMDINKDFLCKNGYIEGQHGQRLYMKNSLGVDWRDLEGKPYEEIKEILSELRKSTNFIIQSENAMILYEALLRLDKKIKKLKLKDKIFLLTTIYDAVYLSVDNTVSDEEIKNILTEVFQVWYTKEVKFKIDVESGQNFKDLQPIE